jgi:c-di-GMP-related signal transduction protein
MNPIYVAKKPINKKQYLAYNIGLRDSIFSRKSLKMKKDKAIKNIIEPCPISPNITPKKKGKLMQVNTAGLASLYEGTPYVSIIN